jgi:hypothetical protein
MVRVIPFLDQPQSSRCGELCPVFNFILDTWAVLKIIFAFEQCSTNITVSVLDRRLVPCVHEDSLQQLSLNVHFVPISNPACRRH